VTCVNHQTLTREGQTTLITPIQEPSKLPTTWPLPAPPPILLLLLLLLAVPLSAAPAGADAPPAAAAPAPAAAVAVEAGGLAGFSCSMDPLTVWSLEKVRVRNRPDWGQLISRSPAGHSGNSNCCHCADSHWCDTLAVLLYAAGTPPFGPTLLLTPFQSINPSP
jgi:hypothetical protein